MSKSQNLGKEIASKIDDCIRDCVSAAMQHIVSSAKNVKLPRTPAVKTGKKPGRPAKKVQRKLSSRVDYEKLAEAIAQILSIEVGAELSLKQVHEACPVPHSTAQLRRAMHQLIDSGMVEQHGDRRGARYVRRVEPAAASADPSNSPT